MNEPRDQLIEATSMISEPDRGRAAAEPSREHDQPEPEQPDDRGDCGRAIDPVAGKRAPHDDLERHRPGDHRRDARVDPLLGDVHEPDSAGEQHDPEG